MIKISLLARAKYEKTSNIIFHEAPLAGVFFIFMIAFLIFLNGGIKSKEGGLDQRTYQVSLELARLKRANLKLQVYKEKETLLKKRIDVIRSLEEKRTIPIRVMESIALSSSSRIWLIALREKDSKLEMEGRSLDDGTIYNFIENLSTSPFLKDIELLKVFQQEEGELKLRGFSLEAHIVLPPRL